MTAVVPPYNAREAGGMEYPTFFTAEGGTSYTPGTITERMLDFVTIHEFGHGYFMGILGSNEFEEPMLDEGVNQYWDERMLADRGEGFHLTTSALRWLGFDPVFKAFDMERLAGVVANKYPADPLDANSWDRMSNASYGSVYMRSAVTFRTLENLVGHEAMDRAMKLYYERWKFRHPSAADFEAALAEGTGKPALVHMIFDSQVYGTERFDASVVEINNMEQVPRAGSYVKDGKRVAVTRDEVKKQIHAARKKWRKQNPDAEHGGPYPYHSVVTLRRDGPPLPETVQVHFADDSHVTLHWDDQRRWKHFTFDKPVKVTSVVIDPHNKILLDANILNNSRALESDSSASRRYASAWSALASTIFSFLVTL